MDENLIWTSLIEDHYKKNKNKFLKKYRFLGDGCEDVVHEAYERALRYANSFNGEDFDRWFSTIIRNSMRDYRRMEYNMPEVEEIDEYDHVGYICSGVPDKIFREINFLIKKKTPEHAEVLNLYFNLGYSYKDVEAVTDYTYFNCYRIIARFKEELIQIYKG